MASVREQVRAGLLAFDGVVESPSQFADRPAFWVGGTEVAHFESASVVELRLTRAEIRARRASLRADPRVELRPSSSSDWLSVRMSSVDDVAFALSLARVAVEAHRAGAGSLVAEPPRGADLARRRRFH